MTTYSAELSKSNRSSCKKCKQKIEKDEIRVGSHATNADGITMVSWTHLNCFVIPKNTDFRDFLEGLEVEGLSPEQVALVTAAFSAARPAGKRSASDGHQEHTSTSSKKTRVESDVDDMPEAERELFEKYKKMTIDELKDYCRWNNQLLGGTKTELIKRCVDGELHGALPECPEAGCRGKLRLENGKVVCPGAFSDDVGVFVRCYFRADPSTLTRLPWRTSAKTEAERQLEQEFKSSIVDDKSTDLFEGLDLSSMPGKKLAAERLLEAATQRGVNVPASEQEAKVRFGSIVMNNSSKTSNEMLALAEEMFGTRVSSAKKAEGSKAGTVCPENEGIVAALSELSEVYFKTGNAQAGNTYRKAVAAIRNYPRPISSGASISKGKNKVDGIGAKCGELIDEFLSTGSISKIAEKKGLIS